MSAYAGGTGGTGVGGCGGGGAGLGGAIFYRHGGALTLSNCTFNNNSVSGGVTFGTGGATNGSGYGTDLFIQANSILQVTGNVEINGTLHSDGNWTKDGIGTLQLNSDNTYTGTTTLAEGEILAKANAALGTGAIIVQSGASLSLQADVTVTNPISIAGVGVSNSGVLRSVSGSNNYANTITMTASSSIGSDEGILTLSGNITDESNGYGFTKVGEGIVVLSGTNTYGSTTTIRAGTLNTQSSGAIPSNPVVIESGATLSVQGGIVLGATSMSIAGSGVGGAGALRTIADSNSYANSIMMTDNSSVGADAGVLALSGNIDDGGNGYNFTKVGAGTVILLGTNTYGGSTTIANGILQAGAVNTLPVETVVSIQEEGIWDLAGFSQTVGNISGSSGALISLANASLTFGSNNSDQTYAGVINQNGNLIKMGTGTVTLTAANDFLGSTTISEGAINVQSNSALGSSGSVTVIASGAALQLQGNITLAQASLNIESSGSLLSISGNNTYTGSITLSGDAIINAVDGILTIDGSIDDGINQYTITKKGAGTLALTGNSTFHGSTTIQQGTLDITGSILSSVIVESGAVLTGAGTGKDVTIYSGGSIQGEGTYDAIVSSGTTSPGNSIGTIHAASFVQTSSGFYVDEINSAGQTDFLDIKGSAVLAGALDIRPASGVYSLGTKYTILKAGGGVSGTFDTVLNSSSVKIGVEYLSNSVVLQVLNGKLALTQPIEKYNPKQVLNYLNSLSYTANTDLSNIIYLLSVDSNPEKALNQMQPSLLGAFDFLNLNTSSYIASILNHQFPRTCVVDLGASCDRYKMSIWLEPFAYLLDQRHVGENVGYDANDWGLIGGWDYRFTNGTLIGFGGGYHSSYIDWDQQLGHGHIRGGYLGIYSNYLQEKVFIETSLLGGVNSYNATRNIRFSTIDRAARHQNRGYDITAHLAGGPDIALKRDVHFKPFLAFDYTYLYQNQFTEHGAKSLDLTVKSRATSMLRSQLGLSISRGWKIKECGCFTPTIWLSGINETYLNTKSFTAYFASKGGKFKVRPMNKAMTMISPGIDLSLTTGYGFSVSVRYSAELSYYTTAQKADLKLERKF